MVPLGSPPGHREHVPRRLLQAPPGPCATGRARTPADPFLLPFLGTDADHSQVLIGLGLLASVVDSTLQSRHGEGRRDRTRDRTTDRTPERYLRRLFENLHTAVKARVGEIAAREGTNSPRPFTKTRCT